ncbi:MAG: serine/threonine-protein kinase [Anaerolineaceae bacterium]
MTFTTGYILNSRYRIVKLLGQGGFGAVYKAWDLNLSHACAVKENLDTSVEAQRQFLREATVLANLSHPNLPRVTDHFILPDQGQYLVMDFIEGEDLHTMLEKSGPLPVDKVLLWMGQVMDALEYLHGRIPPVLHRDIKPANIKITPEGRAVLVDFGLVKLYDSHTKTTMGARAITPGYSPPEQYGQGSTDARSDIYALGATMYMLVTGVQPPESVQRVASDTLRPAQVVNPNIPVNVGYAITQSMALSPEKRFRTIVQMRAAFFGSYAPAIQPIPSAPVPSIPYSSDVALPYAPVKKKGLPAWAIALIIVGALGMIGGLCAVLFTIPGILPTITTSTPRMVAREDTVTPMPTEAPMATVTPYMTRTPVMMNTEVATTYGTTEDLVVLTGPSDGSIAHNADDGLIAVMNSGLSVADYIVKVDFYNPYSLSTGTWDFGLLFREAGFNDQYRLVVLSDGEWFVTDHGGDADGETVASGTLSNLNTYEGGVNTVMLVTYHERGWFFLNGELISELDLSSRQTDGLIELATGLYAGNEINGYSTYYSNFEVWRLDMTPQSGSLIHDSDEYIEEFGTEDYITDFIMVADFTNPYSTSVGNFDCGFMFRNQGGNEQFRLVISQSQSWELTNNAADSTSVITSSTLTNMNTNDSGTNEFSVVALGDKGWFYSNQYLVSSLDLSSRMDAGTNRIATGMYLDDEIPGYSTGYSNFIVIPLP